MQISLMMEGTKETLALTLVSLSMGLAFGFFLGIFNSKKWRLPWVGKIIDLYVSIIRGTPLFVQVLIAYFALPQALDIDLSPFAAGVLALGINSSAYLSEIVRCGVDSIAKGQWEAAYALGYGPRQATIHVILPQMLQNVLPAITNEMTALIKETSILMVIGVTELTKVGRDIVARELNPLPIYLTVAAIYYSMTTLVALGSKCLERRLKR